MLKKTENRMQCFIYFHNKPLLPDYKAQNYLNRQFIKVVENIHRKDLFLY